MIRAPGGHRVGNPARSTRYAARLTSWAPEGLAQRDVVRIVENQPIDEDPGTRLEHAHDKFTSPPVKIVQAHNELRVPRRKLIYLCFPVNHVFMDPGSTSRATKVASPSTQRRPYPSESASLTVASSQRRYASTEKPPSAWFSVTNCRLNLDAELERLTAWTFRRLYAARTGSATS